MFVLDKKPKIKLSVSKDRMEDKRYDPFSLGALSVDTELKDDFTRELGLKECRKRLREAGLSKYKINKFFDNAEAIGVVDIDGIKCIILPVEGQFISIYVDTVKYCMKALSPLSFKIYCYLKKWYQVSENGGYEESYFFSRAEIARELGYFVDKDSIKSVDMCLRTLKKVGLIDYAEEPVGKRGHHGLYTELYSVSEYCPLERKSEKELVERGAW